ncbi:hypothetical protein QVD17_08198 [Tagetes erecta]|uniref:Uncharacterized protein n=1 Tax=Tagetes erecta TaxID=13708 RepID=A0AAD8NXH3_TARER|nr:hypothetical protein QVD17_08198 [Tagetes erecta]
MVERKYCPHWKGQSVFDQFQEQVVTGVIDNLCCKFSWLACLLDLLMLLVGCLVSLELRINSDALKVVKHTIGDKVINWSQEPCTVRLLNLPTPPLNSKFWFVGFLTFQETPHFASDMLKVYGTLCLQTTATVSLQLMTIYSVAMIHKEVFYHFQAFVFPGSSSLSLLL